MQRTLLEVPKFCQIRHGSPHFLLILLNLAISHMLPVFLLEKRAIFVASNKDHIFVTVDVYMFIVLYVYRLFKCPNIFLESNRRQHKLHERQQLSHRKQHNCTRQQVLHQRQHKLQHLLRKENAYLSGIRKGLL